MIRRIGIIARQEMRILFRDIQALALLFLMPLAFIVFLTLALQDVYLAKVGRQTGLVVVVPQSATASDLSARLVAELRHFSYRVEVMTQAPSAPTTDLQLVLPADIEETVRQLKNGETLAAGQKIQLLFEPTLDQSVRALMESHLLLALQAVLIDRAQAERASQQGSSAVVVPNAGHFDGLIWEQAYGGVQLPNPIQQTVPAWALFGMFFIVLPLSNSFIRDRRLGIFKRLLSFPISRGELILGKCLPFLVINVLQFVLMFSVGFFLLPRLTHLTLNLDLNWGHLILVTLACALAATSYGLLVSCVAKTAEQASAFGALSVVILAILGGVMIPRVIMPSFMQSFAQVSPLYWGLEAYHDVILRNSDFLVTLPKLAVLIGFAALCGAVAVRRLRWSEVD